MKLKKNDLVITVEPLPYSDWVPTGTLCRIEGKYPILDSYSITILKCTDPEADTSKGAWYGLRSNFKLVKDLTDFEKIMWGIDVKV